MAAALTVGLLAACSSGGSEVTTGESASGGPSTTASLAAQDQDDGTGGDLGRMIDGVEATTTTVAPETTTTTAWGSAPPVTAPPSAGQRPVVTQPPATLPPTAAPAPAPVTAPPTTAPPAYVLPTNPPPTTATDLSANERRVLDAINGALASKGRPGLTPAADLTGASRNDANKMVAQGSIISPVAGEGTTRSWSVIQVMAYNGATLDNAVAMSADGNQSPLWVPNGATHIGIGVGVDGSGQTFVSLRLAVQ